MWPEKFQCPESMRWHLNLIFEGQYDIEGVPKPSVVLDIGANYGAYTVHAHHLWGNGIEFHAYEPNSAVFPQLIENIVNCNVDSVTFHKAAVSTLGKHAFLRYGMNNPGEASLYDLGEQTVQGEKVKCIHPRDLPRADFIKIDTEGAESDILTGYRYLDTVRGVALEWHRANDIPGLIEILSVGHGLRLVHADAKHRVLKFKRMVDGV